MTQDAAEREVDQCDRLIPCRGACTCNGLTLPATVKDPAAFDAFFVHARSAAN